jgi:hypothetical protein
MKIDTYQCDVCGKTKGDVITALVSLLIFEMC